MLIPKTDKPEKSAVANRGGRKAALYRMLPSVDELLKRQGIAGLCAAEGQAAVTEAARAVLATLRSEIASGRLDEAKVELAISGITTAVEQQLRRSLEHSLVKVINATGVVLHTNLGRAPLPGAALERVRQTAEGYSNLEFDIGAGERGRRDVHVQGLFSRLLNRDGVTGVETVVVNNCAAAVLLALNSLAESGEVVVSRGELVEIGGGFRVPEIMAKAGAVLREVGTTNRTRISDYENAIGEKTRLLLRVHRSNFEIVGFTEQPSLGEMVELGRRRGIPVMEDLGSGALFDMRWAGVEEPGVSESLQAGADLVTYSGDKLMGGPQAGMLSGRAAVIAKVRANPLFRALRVDKLTYAALEGTLMAYLKQDYDGIPTLRMLRASRDRIAERAQKLLESLKRAKTAARAELIPGESVIGGGSAPGAVLATMLLAIEREDATADELAARLRSGDPPVVARVEEGRVLLDLRTVFPEQDAALAKALIDACR